jgi:hypothetical protein
VQTNRLIKKEVLDMAGMMEKMAFSLDRLNQKMDTLGDRLDRIENEGAQQSLRRTGKGEDFKREESN